MTLNLKGATINIKEIPYVEAFKKMRVLITLGPILAYSDFDITFSLTTDASNTAIRAALSQNHKPTCYAGRTLNEHEINYATIQNSRHNLEVTQFLNDNHINIMLLVETHLTNKYNFQIIAAGDFNAKHTHWGSRLVTPKGRQLYYAITKPNYKLDYVSPGSPTYWPTDPRKVPDLIDFAVTKNIPRNIISAKAL